jgi:hypothetical protein
MVIGLAHRTIKLDGSRAAGIILAGELQNSTILTAQICWPPNYTTRRGLTLEDERRQLIRHDVLALSHQDFASPGHIQ